MNKKNMCVLLIVLLFLVTAVSVICNKSTLVSNRNSMGIELSRYFPRESRVIVYNHYILSKNVGWSAHEYQGSTDGKNYNVDVKSQIYNVDGEFSESYEVNNEYVTKLDSNGRKYKQLSSEGIWSNSLDGSIANIETCTLSENYYDITTPVGKFSECIEVTKVEENRKWYFLWLKGDVVSIKKEYWAPGKGLIVSYLKVGSRPFNVVQEIKGY